MQKNVEGRGLGNWNSPTDGISQQTERHGSLAFKESSGLRQQSMDFGREVDSTQSSGAGEVTERVSPQDGVGVPGMRGTRDGKK